MDEEFFKQCQAITDALVKEIRQSNAEKQNTIRIQTVALIISILMLAITNLSWLYVANQYEYATYEQENTDGINNVNLGEMWDVINGKTSSENSN